MAQFTWLNQEFLNTMQIL